MFPKLNYDSDDTARINRGIDFIASLGGGELQLTPGLYNVSTSTAQTRNAIIFRSNVSIRGIGEVKIKLAPNNLTNYGIIHIQNCNNVYAKNLRIIGDSLEHLGTSGTHGMGFNIIESSNVLLDGVQTENCWGDGLYLGTRTLQTITNNKNIVVKNSYFKGRRNAASLISLENGLFDNCTFSEANGALPMAGVDIEPNDTKQTVEKVTFRNCTFQDNANIGFIIVNVKKNVKDINLLDCHFENNPAFSFSGEESSVENVALRRCRIKNSILSNRDKNDGSPSSAIKGASNVTIEGNTFINSGKITIQKNTITNEVPRNINICNNTFIDSVGVEVRSGTNIKISDNFIDNFTNFGIFINRIDDLVTKNIVINKNVISGSKGGSTIATGIRIDAGDEVIVKDNICRKDENNLMIRGISIEAKAGQVTLSGNDCKDGGSIWGIKNVPSSTYMYQNRMKDGTWSNNAN